MYKTLMQTYIHNHRLLMWCKILAGCANSKRELEKNLKCHAEIRRGTGYCED